jgi:hypothetical protein
MYIKKNIVEHKRRKQVENVKVFKNCEIFTLLSSFSEKSLLLATDDLFGNYWWYVFNTNVCFRGYVNVATLTFVHKTRGQTGG